MSLACAKCGRQAGGEHFVAFDLCKVCDSAVQKQKDEERRILAAKQAEEDARKAEAARIAEEMREHMRGLVQAELQKVVQQEVAATRTVETQP